MPRRTKLTIDQILTRDDLFEMRKSNITGKPLSKKILDKLEMHRKSDPFREGPSLYELSIAQLSRKPPPRKGVTSFAADAMEENDDVFVVLELHHGLGKSTRVDLGIEDIEPLVKRLRIARKDAKRLINPRVQNATTGRAHWIGKPKR